MATSDVPDEYISAPSRGEKSREDDEGATVSPKKDLEKDEVQRKIAEHQTHHQDIDMKTTASPHNAGPGAYTEPQPAAAGPRYLHVGDHVLVYPVRELEDIYGYNENESTEFDEGLSSKDFESPEEVHVYKGHIKVSKSQNEGTSSDNYETPENVHRYEESANVRKDHDKGFFSFNYETPEDVQGYKGPETVSEGHDGLSLYQDYNKPENAHGNRKLSHVNNVHGEGTSRIDYETPEDFQAGQGEVSKGQEKGTSRDDYETPENVQTGQGRVSKGQDEESSSDDNETPANAHGNAKPAQVSKGQDGGTSRNDYETPEDVQACRGQGKVIKGQDERTSSSNDYETPEDVHGHDEFDRGSTVNNEGSPAHDHGVVSFAYRAKARLMEIKNKAKANKVCWLVLGCGLLVAASLVVTAALTPRRVPGSMEANDLKNGNGVVATANETKPESPIVTTTGMGNGSAVVNSTPACSANTGVWISPTTVAPLTTTDMNWCKELPCLHGTCENTDPGYNCVCQPGWTGTNCQQDINECTKQPCQHGRCVNKAGSYKCTCSTGWTGQTQNCQNDINECSKRPCHHGRCENTAGGYSCRCVSGWTGQNCQHAPPCKGGWIEYNNHCYKFFKDKRCWSKANEKCKELDANLASVTSAGENNFIARLIADAPKGPVRHLVWFGLNRLDDEKWKWTDGSPLAYKNWAKGEPGNNLFWQSWDCANMYSKDDSNVFVGGKGKKGEWNDAWCGNHFSFVCKAPK